MCAVEGWVLYHCVTETRQGAALWLFLMVIASKIRSIKCVRCMSHTVNCSFRRGKLRRKSRGDVHHPRLLTAGQDVRPFSLSASPHSPSGPPAHLAFCGAISRLCAQGVLDLQSASPGCLSLLRHFSGLTPDLPTRNTTTPVLPTKPGPPLPAPCQNPLKAGPE